MNRTVRDILLEHKMPRIFLVLASLIVGSLIVVTVITTIAIAAPDAPPPIPPEDCQIDAQGVNDQPVQKDLTTMCIDYDYNTAHPTTPTITYEYLMSWNWDDAQRTGTGQSADACSLYDTDNDGYVNYSLCVSFTNGDFYADPKVPPYQVPGYPVLYSCNDSTAYNCPGSNKIASVDGADGSLVLTSTCSVTLSMDDPFGPSPPDVEEGDYYPYDTKATCEIDLDDIPVENPILLDVCSYPSQEPGSAFSDCILYSITTGKLEVIKDLVPSDNSGKFLLYITDVYTPASPGVGDGGSTGVKVVDGGNNYDVGENADTGTNLWDYWKWIECIHRSTGISVAHTTDDDPGPLSVPVANEDDILCTISNYFDPTAVEMANFEAKGQIGTVLIEWTTVFEIDNDGFNLYRSDTLVGGKTKINDELIPTKSSGEFVMTSYQYMDQGLQMGQTYYYWLESVSASGVLNQFDPDSAVSLYGIYLSLVRK